MTPHADDAVDRQVHADIEKWGAVVKEAGIQPE